MPGKSVGSVYLVAVQVFAPEVLRQWRATLSDNEKRCKTVRVKVLGMVSGTRSYECEVVSTGARVTVSSKSLATLDTSRAPDSTRNTLNDDSHDTGSDFEEDELRSESPGSDEDVAVDELPTTFTDVAAQDWARVQHFDDQMTQRHPNFDRECAGRLRGHPVQSPCALFMAFMPLELIEPRFSHWRMHAAEHDHHGIQALDRPMFLRFLALVIKMGLLGLRRRDHYFKEPGASNVMSQRTFESLLYTIRDCGFQGYAEGDNLPDGRIATDTDPLKRVRRYTDELQSHWQEVFVLGSLLVIDESMVGWTGATNVHITVLPNKPTSRGVCLKTLCDAHSRVMVALEFVESQHEQSQKRYVDEGKATAVMLRLTEAWHHKGPRLVLADAWFGGVPTAVALIQRGIFSITNVKRHTKFFCKDLLWEDARGTRRTHQRNDRAYRQLQLQVNGKVTTFVGAFHMDKRPMTLLGTAGSSDEAQPVMRRRVFMSEEGDLVRWTGELQQPNMHAIYRTFFNAVDVHNKLALGPRSVCSVGANHLLLKLWLAVVAIAETNAFLLYSRAKKLTTSEYSHGDFKLDLVHELLQQACKEEADAGSEDEQCRPSTRSSAGSAVDVATGDTADCRTTMPPELQKHALKRSENTNRKCSVCGHLTKAVCGCGLAVCGPTYEIKCWAWHLQAAMHGTLPNEAAGVRLAKRKKS